MNTKMLFKAMFTWPDDIGRDRLTGIYKEMMEKRLIDMHNKFSRYVNERIDSWNMQADSKGLTDNLPSDETWWDTEYVNFMKHKYDMALGELLSIVDAPDWTAWYIGSELELHMILKHSVVYNWKEIDLSYSMKPVEVA